MDWPALQERLRWTREFNLRYPEIPIAILRFGFRTPEEIALGDEKVVVVDDELFAERIRRAWRDDDTCNLGRRDGPSAERTVLVVCLAV